MSDSDETDTAIKLPEVYDSGFALLLARKLNAATRKGLPLKTLLPAETAAALFLAVTTLLAKEPTLLEVEFSAAAESVLDCCHSCH